MCGLGDGGREVDFEIATSNQQVTCKNCLKSMAGDSGKKNSERKMRKEANLLMSNYGNNY